MRLFSFILLFSSLLFSEMLERTQVLMGTYVTISLPQEASKAIQESFTLLKSVEKSLSSYDNEADIFKLNQQRKSVIGPYTYEAFQLSTKYYRESEGYFDITVGSITKGLYHFGENEEMVDTQALQKAQVSFKGVHFSADAAWLEQGIMVDLGGMGKGFGVDKVREYLLEQNITQGVVALSGDIVCLDTCTMGIQNPFGSGVIAEFTTKRSSTAISTSGNYRRYIESTKHNHLINPKEKVSQKEFSSITLLSYGNNSDIDAYATAASVMPLTKAILFLDHLDLAYILITLKGDRYVSKNLDGYVEKFHFIETLD